jgi:hypothetical protein
MPCYCDNETCEAEAVEVVPVSLDEDTVEYRRYCYACSEGYNTGAQHGRFRAMRQLRAYAESLKERGFATEAGVVFAALPKLDTCTDPGEEGMEPLPLENEELDDEQPCQKERLAETPIEPKEGGP